MRKLSLSGAGQNFSRDGALPERSDALIYGGVALGVLAGAAISTWIWRQRNRAEQFLSQSPLERAEQLIASCESKLDTLEKAIGDLQEQR